MTTATVPVATKPRQPKRATHPRAKAGKMLGEEFYFKNPLGVLPYPDHTQLPDEDGTFVKNFQEHPQSILLTDSIKPLLDQLHPDGQYAIGQDSGIYWQLTDPPEDGAEAPDWFYVPNVPPTLDGVMRRSYVMWRETVPPLLVVEFVSGKGDEEKDRTPYKGKFWIYENAIRPLYYAIYYGFGKGKVELFHLESGQYLPVIANQHNRYPIAELHVELGLWQGEYFNATLPWLRWWDANGHLLPTSAEQTAQERLISAAALRQAEQERIRANAAVQQANQERIRAEQADALAQQERTRADRLAAKLRALGIADE